MEIDTAAKHLLMVRTWEKLNLPTYNSVIGFDVILYIMASYGNDRTNNLKSLYRSIDYSESQIRAFIRRLESDHWIVLVENAADRRNRYIKPSQSLIAKFAEYVTIFRKVGDPVG
ncbi:MAG: hypothetical protein ACOYOJ_16555 [Alsobacter sp.]|jgi:DNA-binding MarR family transcriptional regulator